MEFGGIIKEFYNWYFLFRITPWRSLIFNNKTPGTNVDTEGILVKDVLKTKEVLIEFGGGGWILTYTC
jgi:hypothetical protein